MLPIKVSVAGVSIDLKPFFFEVATPSSLGFTRPSEPNSVAVRFFLFSYCKACLLLLNGICVNLEFSKL